MCLVWTKPPPCTPTPAQFPFFVTINISWVLQSLELSASFSWLLDTHYLEECAIIMKFKVIIYGGLLLLALNPVFLLQMGVLLWQHQSQCRPQTLPKFRGLVSTPLLVAMAALL